MISSEVFPEFTDTVSMSRIFPIQLYNNVHIVNAISYRSHYKWFMFILYIFSKILWLFQLPHQPPPSSLSHHQDQPPLVPEGTVLNHERGSTLGEDSVTVEQTRPSTGATLLKGKQAFICCITEDDTCSAFITSSSLTINWPTLIWL